MQFKISILDKIAILLFFVLLALASLSLSGKFGFSETTQSDVKNNNEILESGYTLY